MENARFRAGAPMVPRYDVGMRMVSAIVLFALAAGCSSSGDASNGGSGGGTSTGGSPATGGANSTGGMDAFGGAPGTGGLPGAGGGAGMTGGCDKSTSFTIAGCVEKARLDEDVRFIAQPRTSFTPHWTAVQDLCRERFEQNGFTVEMHDYGSGVNVVGRLEGVERPTEEVLLSAHYDSTPGCEGADDNATGVAAVLEMARLASGTAFARTLVLACWDQEEVGLLGAGAYATRAVSQGQNILVMYSLEMLGLRSLEPNSQRIPPGFDLLFPMEIQTLMQNEFRADFLAIFPDTAAVPVAFRIGEHGNAVGLPNFVLEITDGLKNNPLARDVQRSDHARFWQVNIPAILVTDSSEFRNDNYHCRGGTRDTPDTLDYEFLKLNTQAVVGSVVDTLELR